MAASEAAVTAVMETLGCHLSISGRCLMHWRIDHRPWTDRGCPVAVAAADAAVDADRASIQAETLREAACEAKAERLTRWQKRAIRRRFLRAVKDWNPEVLP